MDAFYSGKFWRRHGYGIEVVVAETVIYVSGKHL
jgi:hypothetical protein